MTRVLLADDHPFLLAGVESVLRGSGYRVIAKLPDGEAALAALGTARPDLLILDVKMPKRDGIDVLLTLRARGDNRPVILLTASLDDHRLLEAVKAGVNGVGLKEGAEDILLQCLDAVRAGKRWIEKELLERALDLSLKGGRRPDPLGALAARERAIVRLVAQGRRNREIADDLGMTEGTVKVYLHNIYQKLGVENRTELAVLATDMGQG